MATSRNYDFIIKVEDARQFESGMFVIGNTSRSVGLVANVNYNNNLIKVKMTNSIQEFKIGEGIHANSFVLIKGANPNVNVYSSNTLYFSNSAPTIVNGNSYIIDGNTSIFPLPNTWIPLIHDAIRVVADGRVVPPDAFLWPAANLGRNGIEFLRRSQTDSYPDMWIRNPNTAANNTTYPKPGIFHNQGTEHGGGSR
jgi:hypothetical protein